jgi:hypothetical protein
MRAIYFLYDARSAKDLGLKIAMYCSLFESLFSTDSTEITHKIAHRIAIFLEAPAAKRCELYAKVKQAYAVRSKVLHGDALAKDGTHGKVIASAVEADDVARRILCKILSSAELLKQFHSKKEALEAYFLRSSFGDQGYASEV